MQATLNGQLQNDGGEATTCWFQWGINTLYGNETAKTGGLLTGNVFSAVITISPGFMYHFRSVAQNSQDVTFGNDQFIVAPPEPFLMSLVDVQLLGVY
jgi:hypothetical protein